MQAVDEHISLRVTGYGRKPFWLVRLIALVDASERLQPVARSLKPDGEPVAAGGQ